MADVLTINVVDVTLPPESKKNIPVINQPNPVIGFEATAEQILELLNFPRCYITQTSNNKPVDGTNFYDLFPDLKPDGGGGKPSPGPGPDPEPEPTRYNVPWGYAYPKPVYFIGIIAEKIHHD